MIGQDAAHESFVGKTSSTLRLRGGKKERAAKDEKEEADKVYGSDDQDKIPPIPVYPRPQDPDEYEPGKTNVMPLSPKIRNQMADVLCLTY